MMIGIFIVLNACIRKEAKSKINKLNSHIKKLDKEDQNKPKASRSKNIIKISTKIKSMKLTTKIQWINDYLKAIKLTKLEQDGQRKKEIRHKKYNKRILKQLCMYKFDYLEKSDQFIKKYKLLQLIQNEVDNSNSLISAKDVKFLL